jgi:hypothetical protein
MSENSQQQHQDSTLYVSTWIWFGTMLLVGVALTALGASTDRFMYDTGAEVRNVESARENFVGVSGLGAETVDVRSQGGLAQARKQLQMQSSAN